MAVTFRNYSSEPSYSKDYRKVRDFLTRINSEKITTPRMLWGAWDWAAPPVWHQHLAGKIGLWEDNGKLVALATYESRLGEGFLCLDESYPSLKPDLISHAKEHLHDNGKLILSLPDGDSEFGRTAISQGFRPTEHSDRSLVLDMDMLQAYSLPKGFSFVSMADDWNWYQYHRVMWRGFNHEGRPPHDDKTISERKTLLSIPEIKPEIKVCVAAPDGNYVSHCGMWYQPGDFYCYVEPVATDPEYRKMGLGKAAVLEAVRRCGQMGAKQAIVGSNQQFYFNIGFYPLQTLTHWELVL